MTTHDLVEEQDALIRNLREQLASVQAELETCKENYRNEVYECSLLQAELEEERRLLGLCKSKATVIHSRYTRAKAERDELKAQLKRYENGLERIALITRATYTNPWSAINKIVEIATEIREWK